MKRSMIYEFQKKLYKFFLSKGTNIAKKKGFRSLIMVLLLGAILMNHEGMSLYAEEKTEAVSTKEWFTFQQMNCSVNEEHSSVTIEGMEKKDETEVVIPDTINGLPVTGIGDWAFYECKNLKKIELPESIEKIGENAFDQCISLKEIRIPSRVTALGEWIFSGCSALEKVELPESIEKIGDDFDIIRLKLVQAA